MFMNEALQQAQAAIMLNEVPVGAVIVKDNRVIASAHNLNNRDYDPTSHAEIKVMRAACEYLKSSRLDGCDLYVTLEPCPMCAQAISIAKIRRLYFGAYDTKGGGVVNGARIFQQKSCFHIPEVYSGIMEEECSVLLKKFFQSKR